VGGVVGFNAAGADMIQRTLIYAPGKHKTQSASSTGGESMRALKFLPGKDFDPPSWIPDSVASYKTMYIDLQNAFANCHDLYDDVYGDGIAGTLQRLLDDYRSEGGPEVDLGRQIVAHLAGRVTMIGNDVTPVHEANESDIVAFSVVKSGQSQDEVASALGRMFGGEGSGGKKIKLPGHKRFLWKTGEDSTDFPDEEGFVFHSSGVIVTRDHLFYSDDYKQMRRFLTTKAGSKPLAETAAYRRVSDRLNHFAKETPSMKTYSDYRRDWHNGYELLRLQKAKDSESMPARLMLNLLAVLTNATTDSLDIDFVKMPAFDQIKHHLGTGGMIGRDHESGWLLEGVILPPGE